MKNHIFATACLMSFACGSQAQSSVNISGIVDAWVGQVHNKGGSATPGRFAVVDSGGAQASRWRVRGSEDLGGGLRADFVLEQGISIDSGTVTNVSASNVGFNRTAYVGIAGPFGELRLGRMLTAYDAMRGSTNHLYDSSGFASTLQVWSAGTTAGSGQAAVAGSDYLARGNNTVMFITPRFGPVSGSLSVSAGEGATTASGSPRLVTAHVKYESGPARIGLAYQNERYTTGDNNSLMVSGNYDFGTFRMVGAFQRQTDERVAGDQKSREFEVGLDVPLGAYTVAFGYAGAITRNAAGDKVVDADGVSAMATYNFSRRTRVYAAMRKISVDRGDGSLASRASRYGVGVSHTF